MSIEKKSHSHLLKRILLIILVAVAALAAVFLIYTGQYYHAGNTAMEIMRSPSSSEEGSIVTITKESEYWFFDGPGTDSAVIFYPGAKVQTESYAPVLYLLAENGYDSFLVDMPFRLAVFGTGRAEDVMDQYHYSSWYIAGHSLGGAMAGTFAADHMDQLDGIIFLAAYPTKNLGGLRALSIYGSEDGVLNRQRYGESLKYMPDDFTEEIIDGGNHAQFGDYGTQKGDGEAAISPQEQWEETVNIVADWLEE